MKQQTRPGPPPKLWRRPKEASSGEDSWLTRLIARACIERYSQTHRDNYTSVKAIGQPRRLQNDTSKTPNARRSGRRTGQTLNSKARARSAGNSKPQTLNSKELRVASYELRVGHSRSEASLDCGSASCRFSGHRTRQARRGEKRETRGKIREARGERRDGVTGYELRVTRRKIRDTRGEKREGSGAVEEAASCHSERSEESSR